ncbi:MAG: transglutaminase-like domain-containing protein [Thermoanaerobaculia bacterium]
MRKIRLFAIAFIVILCAGSSVRAADGPPLDYRADFIGAHREVFSYQPFLQWDQPAQFQRWGESSAGDGDFRIVYAQKAGPITSSEIFAMRVTQPEEGEATVLDHRLFSQADVLNSYNAAKASLFNVMGFTGEGIGVATPVPGMSGATITLRWRLSTRGVESRTFLVDPNGPLLEVPTVVPPHTCTPGIEDAESTNDLHHPHDAAVTAFADVTATGTHEIVYRLFRRVFKRIDYDMTNNNDVFTDSDNLILRRRSGMCDEKAVVLISALRANGIPARLKMVLWTRKGVTQAHACVEYFHKQQNQWFHVDPTWGVVQNPSVYRNIVIDGEHVTNVRVVDADWPDDARSTSVIIPGVVDITGDGRLDPWGDFCYFPSKLGEERPGYSN